MPMATTSKHRDRSPTDEKRQVADILVQLPKLIQPFRSLSGIRWGRKRRRSSLPTAPSTSCSGDRPLPDVEAASPATPLSFCPSDADEYSRPKISRRRNFRKKSHKELKEEIARLSAERIQLENEYSKRSEYRNELQALNFRLISELKGRQSQLSLQAVYQPHLRHCRRSLDYLISNLPTGTFPGNQCPNIINHLLVRPSTADLRAEDSSGVPCSHEGQQPSLALMPSGPGLALEENHSTTVAILDLNAPPKATISFDFFHIPVQFKKNKAAIAAEARKKRMEINREKSSLSLKQSRFR